MISMRIGVEDESEPGVNNIQVAAIDRETMLSIATTAHQL
jgi:hypothetical protein